VLKHGRAQRLANAHHQPQSTANTEQAARKLASTPRGWERDWG